MSATQLRIDGLCVTYRRYGRRLPVLKDVDLSVSAGEAVGVVGESGCGKTTLALSVMRFLPRNGRVEAGEVWLAGRNVLELDDDALREIRGGDVAMVYQDPGAALNPALRIGEQVAEVYRSHSRCTKREAFDRARHILEQVALPHPGEMIRRYPHQLSGGQQQRVVIAMALAGNPGLLILDEPTTGLDATVEAEVLDLISKLRETFGTSLLFISHNLAVVGRVCDRVAVFYAGRVVEFGETGELFARPRHPYTRGLLGCLPTLGATKRARRLVAIPGRLPSLGSALPGCQFSPRCDLAIEECRRAEPTLAPCEDGTLVRCWRAAESATLHPGPGVETATGDPPPNCLAGKGLTEEGPGALAPTPISPPSTASADPQGRDPLVRVEGLQKKFSGGVLACHDISFEIWPGETVGLVGESGSGKTTLARCLAGLTTPDGGRISLRDQVVPLRLGQRTKDQRRNIQMVFQNPDMTLNPSHSVGFVLGRAAKKLAGGGDVVALAEATGIAPELLPMRCGQLSGGQKQRVAIARAFAGSPSLVLCDEPCSSLDVSIQATILNLFADSQTTTGVGYLFVSHDLAVVRYLADRILVMYLGEIVEQGAAADVFSPPHHPYTEALFSAMAVLDTEHKRERIRLPGEPPRPGEVEHGCVFHTRCPRKRGTICEDEPPPAHNLSGGHVVRCHWSPDELAAMQSPGGAVPVARGAHRRQGQDGGAVAPVSSGDIDAPRNLG